MVQVPNAPRVLKVEVRPNAVRVRKGVFDFKKMFEKKEDLSNTLARVQVLECMRCYGFTTVPLFLELPPLPPVQGKEYYDGQLIFVASRVPLSKD